ncbi:MAG: haloacid dehalogenase [Armatimonadetes bacterium]|nr:haloacid dehalogenase [Armatimonadota bacterium]
MLEEADAAREQAYRLQREVTRAAASTIRAVHRHAFDDADGHLAETRGLCATMNGQARQSPQVYYAGFVLDAQKEYAEAALVLALVAEREVPTHRELDIEPAPYLNGLAEAAGELRRFVLDALKSGDHTTAERLLEVMDGIYYLLVTFDYPDQISQGLKRRLDMVRAVLERTQGDVLTTLREAHLQAAVHRLHEA